jgi:hypothetical protein
VKRVRPWHDAVHEKNRVTDGNMCSIASDKQNSVAKQQLKASALSVVYCTRLFSTVQYITSYENVISE